jgi:purine nucleosidase
MSFLNNILWSIRRVIWKIRRMVIILLILSLVASVVYLVIIIRERSKVKIFSAIIDADTGNGISDLFAISRALADPAFEVIGLTSVQWDLHPEAIGETVDLSQALNDTLLKLFKKEDIPHPKGGEKMLGYGNEPVFRPSGASEFIVKKANETSDGKKLNIITLGPMTNLAIAILSDSAIIPKLRIYSLAMHYDPSRKVWNKNEFNIRNDLDALDLVLNTANLEMHIMPLSSSHELVLSQDETVDHLQNKGEPWSFIIDRWPGKSPGREEVSIPDVALVEAVLKPDYAKEEQTNTPPENKNRQIFVFTSINKEFMKIDFWKAIKKFISHNG